MAAQPLPGSRRPIDAGESAHPRTLVQDEHKPPVKRDFIEFVNAGFVASRGFKCGISHVTQTLSPRLQMRWGPAEVEDGCTEHVALQQSMVNKQIRACETQLSQRRQDA